MRQFITILLVILTIVALLCGVVNVANGQASGTTVYLPLIAHQLALPAEGRCSMSKTADTNGAQIDWDIPTLPEGQRGIAYFWRDGWSWGGKTLAKAKIGSSENPWRLKNAGGNLWTGRCSPEQLEYEFALDNTAAEINWQQLDNQGFIRSDETATPIPQTATNTPVPPTATRTSQSTATATAASAGCSGMTGHSFPAQQAKTFPSLPNGSIFNLYRADLGEFKLWFPPGEPTWTLYAVSGSWWIDESGKCTTDQVYSEFKGNPLPEKKWDELCSLGVTCPPPTPTNTSTATNTPTATWTPTATATPFLRCQMSKTYDTNGQILEWQVDTLANQSAIVLVWRNGWSWQGKNLAKAKIGPGEGPWLFKDSGGSLWTGSCSTEQLQYEFDQNTDAAPITWTQLKEQGFIR